MSLLGRGKRRQAAGRDRLFAEVKIHRKRMESEYCDNCQNWKGREGTKFCIKGSGQAPTLWHTGNCDEFKPKIVPLSEDCQKRLEQERKEREAFVDGLYDEIFKQTGIILLSEEENDMSLLESPQDLYAHRHLRAKGAREKAMSLCDDCKHLHANGRDCLYFHAPTVLSGVTDCTAFIPKKEKVMSLCDDCEKWREQGYCICASCWPSQVQAEGACDEYKPKKEKTMLPALVTEEDAKEHCGSEMEALLWSLKKWNVYIERRRMGSTTDPDIFGGSETCACCRYRSSHDPTHCVLGEGERCDACSPYYYDWANATTRQKELETATAMRDRIFDVLNEKIVEAGKVEPPMSAYRVEIDEWVEGETSGWKRICDETKRGEQIFSRVLAASTGEVCIAIRPQMLSADSKQPEKVEKKADYIDAAGGVAAAIRGNFTFDTVSRHLRTFVNAVIDEREAKCKNTK